VDEGLVVAVLVDAAELQVAVDVEADVVGPAGDGEALVGGLVGEHDGGVVELVLGEALDAGAEREEDGEDDGDDGGLREGEARAGQLVAEGAGAGEGDERVEQAE
jgi:hypothetical protein